MKRKEKKIPYYIVAVMGKGGKNEK